MSIHLSARMQRAALRLWPITVLIVAPLLIAEALNLWRKNKK